LFAIGFAALIWVVAVVAAIVSSIEDSTIEFHSAHGEREVIPARWPGKLQRLITCGARYVLIWVFLGMGDPQNHNIWGTPHFWKPPYRLM